MFRGYSKRLDEIEKRLNTVSLKIHKFTESDLSRYLKICQRFTEQFPGRVSFVDAESSDVGEMAKVWCQNVAALAAHAEIQDQLGNPLMKEFVESELPGIWPEADRSD